MHGTERNIYIPSKSQSDHQGLGHLLVFQQAATDRGVLLLFASS
jgi:hypothetical protein